MPATTIVKGSSQFSFGEQASAAAVAATKNKWPGAQHGELKFPFPEVGIEDIRGGNLSLDAIKQYVKESKFEGNFDVVVQHAWWFYWLLGANTDSGVNPYDHAIRGATTPVWATLHEALGMDDGTRLGIDWIGCLAKKASFGMTLNSHLTLKADYAALTFDDTVAAQTITETTQDPYLWSQGEWFFYNPGTTNALTGLTTPAALEKWDADVSYEIDEIRGHRTSNAERPLLYVKGSRRHNLNLGLVPAADRTLFQKLTKDRVKFDFVYKVTRSANDYIQWTWRDCYAKSTPHTHPKEDKAFRVDVPIQPRKLDIDVRDSYSTLLAAA